MDSSFRRAPARCYGSREPLSGIGSEQSDKGGRGGRRNLQFFPVSETTSDRTKNVTPRPRLEIEYCTQCRWLLRAVWMLQELLMTLHVELGRASLVPGTGGVFEVRLDGETLWSRKARGRFPELKQLKELVRDRVAPNKQLGHCERVERARHTSTRTGSPWPRRRFEEATGRASGTSFRACVAHATAAM